MSDETIKTPVYEGLSELLSDLEDRPNPAKGFALAAAAGTCDESADCADCTDCSDCGSDCGSDCRSDCSDCSDCSDTPTYLVSVDQYVDGGFYDYHAQYATTQIRSVGQWMSYVGASIPSGATFVSGDYTLGSTSGSCTLATMLTNSARLSITIYYTTEEPHTPITITGGSLSKSSIMSGDEITMTWSASGDLETTGSWNLERTTTSTYSNPVGLANLDQSHAKSYSMTWGPTGTYYVWVFYYGQTGSGSYTSNVYCLGSVTVSPSPTKYTLTVQTYLNNSLYGSGTVSNIVSGTAKTYSQWLSDSGASIPPSPATFQKYSWNGVEFTDTSKSLSVAANVTMLVYYRTYTSNVIANIFYNGRWHEADVYIFYGGQWHEADADLFYTNGWANR